MKSIFIEIDALNVRLSKKYLNEESIKAITDKIKARTVSIDTVLDKAMKLYDIGTLYEVAYWEEAKYVISAYHYNKDSRITLSKDNKNFYEVSFSILSYSYIITEGDMKKIPKEIKDVCEALTELVRRYVTKLIKEE